MTTVETKRNVTAATNFTEVEFLADWVRRFSVRTEANGERRAAVASYQPDPTYYMGADFDNFYDAEKQAAAYGLDLRFLFPRDGLPVRGGRALILALDELLLDPPGRRDVRSYLETRSALPLPTVLLSNDFRFEAPTVFPGQRLARVGRLEDGLRIIRDSHIV